MFTERDAVDLDLRNEIAASSASQRLRGVAHCRQSDRLARLSANTGLSYTTTGDAPAACSGRLSTVNAPKHFLENEMGKYFLGWILGVPVVVLVGIYLVMHVL